MNLIDDIGTTPEDVRFFSDYIFPIIFFRGFFLLQFSTFLTVFFFKKKVVMLVVAYHCGAQTMGEFTRKEFSDGLKDIGYTKFLWLGFFWLFFWEIFFLILDFQG